MAFYHLQYPNFVNIRPLYGAISSDKREFTVINKIYKYIYTLYTGIHYIIILGLIDNHDYNCISAGSIAVYYSLSLESSLTTVLPMSQTLNAEQELYSGMGLVPNKNSRKNINTMCEEAWRALRGPAAGGYGGACEPPLRKILKFDQFQSHFEAIYTKAEGA